MSDKDTIYRQAAIDALARTAREKFNLSDEFNHYLAGLMDGENAIRWLPSAQTERKKGKWIHHTDWEYDGECGYECSVCGMGSDVDYDFCMRCGADMRG